MSAEALGWVLRHGPTDRLMRAVLLVIADSANASGRYSEPGLAAMLDGARLDSAAVLGVVDQLLDDGWVVAEHAESAPWPPAFRLCMDRLPGGPEVADARR